jgi:anti-sigma factor RsiW
MVQSKISEYPKIVAHELDEALEAYIMGTLPLSECSRLEEHVLWCAKCQEQLQAAHAFVAAIRAAFAQPKR